jgi:hypothetical protein
MAIAVAHLDEIEEFEDAGCHYRPIRHHLGITAFGVTAWTSHVAGERVINEHDEDDPSVDQELFVVLRGHATFELEGTRSTRQPDSRFRLSAHVPNGHHRGGRDDDSRGRRNAGQGL